MKLDFSQLAGRTACVLALTSVALAGDVTDYVFREPPVNSMGVTSLADLRGKPVLIDFWGTR